ncbi:MAG: hypothetical protein AB203_02505 [Parcubacteria bacterium C7867-008]|nr:MAG: hypothetical protein AB203_02505 [Parcubacteria bacterium C7867-008]
MVLTDKDIAEFQELWKKHYGTEITKAQALDKGLRLVRLIEAMSRAVAGKECITNKPPHVWKGMTN